MHGTVGGAQRRRVRIERSRFLLLSYTIIPHSVIGIIVLAPLALVVVIWLLFFLFHFYLILVVVIIFRLFEVLRHGEVGRRILDMDFSSGATLFETFLDDPAKDLDLASETLDLFLELEDLGAFFTKGLGIRVA